MKIIALLVVLCTFSADALAQGATCQSIPKASDRLACYDKAALPTSSERPATPNVPAAQQGQFIDQLAIENAKLDAKIKNICRGC